MTIAAILSWLVIGPLGHVLGTYLACRVFGFRALEAALGFGPSLIQIERAGTRFKLNAIPFLAYVRIAGTNPYETSSPSDPGSFANGSLTARGTTILAGPIGSLAMGLCLLLTSGWFGHEENGGSVVVAEAHGPASHVVTPGEVVLGEDGRHAVSVAALAQQLTHQADGQLSFRVERTGPVEVRVPFSAGEEPGFGVSFARVAPKHMSLLSAPIEALELTWLGVKTFGAGLSAAWQTGSLSWVTQSRQTSGNPLGQILLWAGALVMLTAAYNLLPLPALAGGRLALIAHEAITREPLTPTAEARLHAVGQLVVAAIVVAFTIAMVRRCGSPESSDAAEHLRRRGADFDVAAQTFERWGAREPRLDL